MPTTRRTNRQSRQILTNPGVVYAVWDVYDAIDGDGDHTVFSRTTDGGATWESARTIYMPGGTRGHNGDQIVVLPERYRWCACSRNKFSMTRLVMGSNSGSALLRSTDQGQTWSGPIGVAHQFWVRPTDPENGVSVKSRGLPACAVDRRSGNLYAVWEDSRFSNSQYSDIVFSMSADSGLNWSAPDPDQPDTAPHPHRETNRRFSPASRSPLTARLA